MNFLEFIANNLSHVLPILISAAIAAAIMLERYKALYIHYPMKNSEMFFSQVEKLVIEGKVNEATALCDQFSTKPVAQVTKVALLRAHLPDDAIEQGVAMKLSQSVRAIQKRTSFLGTIANVATLLGLIGTIAGLIQSFDAVGHADAQQKSALLSAGIATAMNATMLGLAVAIPCMILFSLFVNRANKIIGDLEDSAMRTMDMLKLRYYRAEEKSSRSA